MQPESHAWSLADVAWEATELRAEAARDTPSSVFEPPLALRTSAESEAEPLLPVICSPLALACLVAGCTQLQAQSASAYCKRVRFCATHARAPSVLVCGVLQRLCQGCNRPHELPLFDGQQRTCRAKSEVRNARRRKPRPPPGGGDAVAHSGGGNGERTAGKHGAASGAWTGTGGGELPDTDDDDLQRFLEIIAGVTPGDGSTGANGVHTQLFGTGAALPSQPLLHVPPLPPLPLLREGPHVWVKLHAATPLQVPWGQDMADALRAAARAACAAVEAHAQLPPLPGLAELPPLEPLAVTGYISPGCTEIALHALRLCPSTGSPAVDEPAAAAAALAALFGARGAAGQFFRSAHARAALTVAASEPLPSAGAHAPELPPLSPLAALCTAPVEVRFAGATSAAAGDAVVAQPRARFHGHRVQLLPRAAASRVFASLPPLGLEGCCMLDCLPSSTAAPAAAPGREPAALPRPPPAARARPLLLTADPAIVAEVTASEAALLAATPAGEPPARSADVEDALLALGHVMRRHTGPGGGSARCRTRLAAFAAAACMRLGWRAATSRALAALAADAMAVAPAAEAAEAASETEEACTATSAEFASAATLPGGVTLLHCAAAAGLPSHVEAVLAAGSPTCGSDAWLGAAGDAAPGCGGATPLHLAAAVADVAAAAACVDALCVTGAGGAVVAWVSTGIASSALPFPPAAVAEARGGLLAAASARIAQRAAVGAAAAAAARAAVQARRRNSDSDPDGWSDDDELAAALLRRAAGVGALPPDVAAVAVAWLQHRRAEAQAVPRPAGAGRAVERYEHWRARHVRQRILVTTCMQAAFNCLQAIDWVITPSWDVAIARGTPFLPAAHGADGVVRLPALGGGRLPLWRYLYTWTLPLQAATSLAAFAVLAAERRASALSPRAQNAVLTAQIVSHMLLSTLGCGLAQALMTRRARVIWPILFAVNTSSCTLIGFFGWPLPLRRAAPLLAMRAALPLLAHLTLAPVWLDSPPMGVACQVGACALAAAMLWRQEWVLRRMYATEAAKRIEAKKVHCE